MVESKQRRETVNERRECDLRATTSRQRLHPPIQTTDIPCSLFGISKLIYAARGTRGDSWVCLEICRESCMHIIYHKHSLHAKLISLRYATCGRDRLESPRQNQRSRSPCGHGSMIWGFSSRGRPISEKKTLTWISHLGELVCMGGRTSTFPGEVVLSYY